MEKVKSCENDVVSGTPRHHHIAAPDVEVFSESVPTFLQPVTDKAYAAEKAAWTAEHGAAFKRGEVTPEPPLNREQRAAARRVVPGLRALKASRQTGLANGQSREQYSTLLCELNMLFLLVGAAGVGKSHMLKAVLRVMHDEDLGGAVFSAYTGVAVTHLPAPSATCCTLLGISGDAFAITINFSHLRRSKVSCSNRLLATSPSSASLC